MSLANSKSALARCSALSGAQSPSSRIPLPTSGLPIAKCFGSKKLAVINLRVYHSRRLPLQHVIHTRSDSLIARMGIKWMESFESSVELPEERKKELECLLENETFCRQVAAETIKEEGSQLEYTGMLFQPVPWSPATPKGMPKEYQEYHEAPDYVTINVPPNFLFQSKIFQPSRLCAIYQKKR